MTTSDQYNKLDVIEQNKTIVCSQKLSSTTIITTTIIIIMFLAVENYRYFLTYYHFLDKMKILNCLTKLNVRVQAGISPQMGDMYKFVTKQNVSDFFKRSFDY